MINKFGGLQTRVLSRQYSSTYKEVLESRFVHFLYALRIRRCFPLSLCQCQPIYELLPLVFSVFHHEIVCKAQLSKKIIAVPQMFIINNSCLCATMTKRDTDIAYSLWHSVLAFLQKVLWLVAQQERSLNNREQRFAFLAGFSYLCRTRRQNISINT